MQRYVLKLAQIIKGMLYFNICSVKNISVHLCIVSAVDIRYEEEKEVWRKKKKTKISTRATFTDNQKAFIF